MDELQQSAQAELEVIHPSGERSRIRLEPLPFRIGRGPDNHLILRDNRASRAHAKISRDHGAGFVIEDLASLHGTWVNGARIDSPAPLRAGDAIHFGFADSYRLVFWDGKARIPRLLEQISASGEAKGAAAGLARLRALVELARSLETTLARDEVLGAIVEAALAVTKFERGFLLLRGSGGLEIKAGRDAQGRVLQSSSVDVPAGEIARALEERRDLLSADLAAQGAHAAQGICVPLVQFPKISADETLAAPAEAVTVGVLYLESDSQASGAPAQGLSELDRELLHTLALEASTIFDNARLLEQERQSRLLEQEVLLARQMQARLLPRKLPDSGWLCAAGSSTPSAEMGGDYFDVQPLGPDGWAAVIADVSGKGVPAALLASLLQGAFLLGAELEASLDALLEKISAFLTERTQGEKYATLWCGKIERSGALAWANAGHTEPLLVSAAGSMRRLRSTGMPLGLCPGAAYGVEREQLEKGDKIIAFSDGLIEAEDEAGARFESRLADVLATATRLSAQATHDLLLEEMARFRGSATPRDDVTLLVLEFRAG